jgi:protein arginine kinase activator
MTGKPCFHQKTFHVTEVNNYQAEVEHHLCNGCAPTYVQLSQAGQTPMLFSNPTPTPPTTEVVVQEEEEEPKPIPVKKGKGKKPKYIETADELFELFMMKPKKKEIACPECGMTPADFKKTGKMGCPECYNFYKNDVPDVLAGCQDGSTKHVGKKPKTPRGNPVEILKTLKLKMAHAVEHEKYEEAIELKKRIAVIEEKMSKEKPDETQEDNLGRSDGG